MTGCSAELHSTPVLRFDDLGLSPAALAASAQHVTGEELLDLEVVISRQIKKALDRTGGKIHAPGGAGELLGVNLNALRCETRKL